MDPEFKLIFPIPKPDATVCFMDLERLNLLMVVRF
jgi:hypothetical protein